MNCVLTDNAAKVVGLLNVAKTHSNKIRIKHICYVTQCRLLPFFKLLHHYTI